jgi:hypothetical protein
VISSTKYRVAGMAGVLSMALALGGGTAQAQWQQQQQQQRVDVYQAGTINGTLRAGSTLTASGGATRGPNGYQWRWEWMTCPNNNSADGCVRRLVGNSQYALSSADVNRYVVLLLYAWTGSNPDNPSDSDLMWTTAGSRVAAAPAPTPTPTPTPAPPTPTPAPAAPTPTATPVPIAAPAPAPTFDVAKAAPTPVPTSGQVLHETASSRRVIKPFPVVRMRGRLTLTGARVTLLSVRAPKSAKISVSCQGSCPTSRWSRSNRKSRLTRVGPFERMLKAGTRLTVTVTRSGYVGKRTTFLIRRGAAPVRADRCLAHNGRTTTCPAGV